MFGEKKKRIPGEFDAAFAGMAQGYSPLSQATASQGAIGNMAPVNNAVAAAPTTLAPKKTGLFGKGGVGRAIAGTIGDFLMQRSGMAPVYAPTMMQQRQEAAQAAAEQRKYSMDLAMHDAKKQIDKRYDTPEVGVFEDNAGNRWTYDKATGRPLGDAPVFVDGTPKEFVHEGMRFSIQNPYLRGQNPGGGSIPRVTDEASYNALPAGSQFYDDEGKLRTKSGGPTQPASGGF